MADDAGAPGPDPVLDVVVAVVGQQAVVTLVGEVDLGSAGMLVDAVADVTAAGAREVTLDITDVTFFDSYGIRSVLTAQGLAEQLSVTGASTRIRRVFELLGLSELLS